MRPATNVFHGLRYAATKGRSPNVFVTINFTDLGFTSADDACAFFSDLRARLRRAWKYRRDKGLEIGALDDVGSHENPDDMRHVHWLVRVPPMIRPWFELTLDKLIRKMTGLSDLGTALHIQDIQAVGSVAKYILKGLDPQYAGYFHMETVDQGVVHGRRTFVARTLGFKARKADGWARKRRPKGAPQRRSPDTQIGI